MNKNSKKNWKGNELKKPLTIIVSKQKVPQISFFFPQKSVLLIEPVFSILLLYLEFKSFTK